MIATPARIASFAVGTILGALVLAAALLPLAGMAARIMA